MADKIEVNVDQLIRLVRARPCIWDGSKKNGFERQQKWQEIYSIMHPGYENLQEGTRIEKGDAIKTKWKKLQRIFKRRCTHLLELKKTGRFNSKIAKHQLEEFNLGFLWDLYGINELLSSSSQEKCQNTRTTLTKLISGKFKLRTTIDSSSSSDDEDRFQNVQSSNAGSSSEKQDIKQHSSPTAQVIEDSDCETEVNFRISTSTIPCSTRRNCLQSDSSSGFEQIKEVEQLQIIQKPKTFHSKDANNEDFNLQSVSSHQFFAKQEHLKTKEKCGEKLIQKCMRSSNESPIPGAGITEAEHTDDEILFRNTDEDNACDSEILTPTEEDRNDPLYKNNGPVQCQPPEIPPEIPKNVNNNEPYSSTDDLQERRMCLKEQAEHEEVQSMSRRCQEDDLMNDIQSFIRPNVVGLSEAQMLAFKAGILNLLLSIKFPEFQKKP